MDRTDQRAQAEHERHLNEHEHALEARRYAPANSLNEAAKRAAEAKAQREAPGHRYAAERPSLPDGKLVRSTDGALLGWVWAEGCEHPNCLAAVDAGRPYHAAPLYGQTLPDYHFESYELAVQALERVWRARKEVGF